MKGVRVPDETRLEACQYADVHGDAAACVRFGCSVDSLRAWRKQFGFRPRSRAPNRPASEPAPEPFED